jgi:ATP-binding cassette subfamily B (MDR/TAP) protein 1
MPVLIVTGFLQMRLMDTLQDHLRDAYGNSASLATEQIAAIRTVASLRRENALHAEFVSSLDAPVRKAMIVTIKSTIVITCETSNDSIIHSVKLSHFSSMYVLCEILTQALIFWYGSTLLREQEYSVLQFFVCLLAVTLGSQGSAQFYSFAPDITKAISAVINITRLLEHKPDIDVWSTEGVTDRLERGHIEFKNVHFSYPTR